jgi:hypothetical protein
MFVRRNTGRNSRRMCYISMYSGACGLFPTAASVLCVSSSCTMNSTAYRWKACRLSYPLDVRYLSHRLHLQSEDPVDRVLESAKLKLPCIGFWRLLTYSVMWA